MDLLVQTAISSLGYLEDGVYFPEPDCLEALLDLARYLKNDDKKRTARLLCAERNIVQHDLIPLMKSASTSDELFNMCLRLATHLCQPTIVAFGGDAPEDREQFSIFAKHDSNLLRMKRAFADVEFFQTIKNRMHKFFRETEWENRQENDRFTMEITLILLRSIFAINPRSNDIQTLLNRQSITDQMISAFLQSGLDDVLIFIGVSTIDREFHVSVMEIFALLLRDFEPRRLLSSSDSADKENVDNKLHEIFTENAQKKQVVTNNVLASRHSRFGGSYVIKGRTAINKQNDAVSMKPLQDPTDLGVVRERKKRKIAPKNRRLNNDEAHNTLRLIAGSPKLLKQLNLFVIKFLEKGFNRLSKSCQEKAFAFATTRNLVYRNADLLYLQLLNFVLEYARLGNIALRNISIALGRDLFHLVQVKLENYLETSKVEKKKTKFYGLRATACVRLYKELLLFNEHIEKVGDKEEKECASESWDYIFRMQEYRDLPSSLFVRFKPGSLPKDFLRELVFAVHYYLKHMEKKCKLGELKVEKKSIKRRRKNTQKSKKKSTNGVSEDVRYAHMSKAQIEDVWNEIESALRSEIENPLCTQDFNPINPILSVEDEEHQKFLLLRIQNALREKNVALAVALNTAGGELWPAEDVFCATNSGCEHLCEYFHEILSTNMEEIAESLNMATKEAYHNDFDVSTEQAEAIEHDNNEESGSDAAQEEYDSEPEVDVQQIDFEFPKYVAQFARPDVLQWYVLLLNDFDENIADLNKALVKLLHRVAFGIKESNRLFQVSLFLIFKRVYDTFKYLSPEAMKSHRHYQLYEFGHHLLQKFFQTFDRIGSKLAVECLFWKGAKEAYEIDNGYGSFKVRNVEATWNEELEHELRSLHDDFFTMDERPEGMDILDFIEHNLSRARTRVQIARKLREFGLDLLGAKQSKAQFSKLPLCAIRDAANSWREMDEATRGELVDHVQHTLKDADFNFTKAKLIKELTHLGFCEARASKIQRPAKAFPLAKLRQIVEDFKAMSFEEKVQIDLADYAMQHLSNEESVVSRGRLIKMLCVLGMPYEKTPKWETDLLVELQSLKLQYDTLENHEKCSVPVLQYVQARLSKKRSEKQVAHFLRLLGEDIPKKPKKPRKSKATNFAESDKQKAFQSSSEHETQSSDIDNGTDDEIGNDNSNFSSISSPSRGTTYSPTKINAPLLAVQNADNCTDDSEDDNSLILRKPTNRRILALSDDDGEEAAAAETAQSDSETAADDQDNLPNVAKRRRVVMSDSDQD